MRLHLVSTMAFLVIAASSPLPVQGSPDACETARAELEAIIRKLSPDDEIADKAAEVIDKCGAIAIDEITATVGTVSGEACDDTAPGEGFNSCCTTALLWTVCPWAHAAMGPTVDQDCVDEVGPKPGTTYTCAQMTSEGGATSGPDRVEVTVTGHTSYTCGAEAFGCHTDIEIGYTWRPPNPAPEIDRHATSTAATVFNALGMPAVSGSVKAVATYA